MQLSSYISQINYISNILFLLVYLFFCDGVSLCNTPKTSFVVHTGIEQRFLQSTKLDLWVQWMIIYS